MSRLHQCTEETLSQRDNTWMARLVAQLDTAIVSTQAYAYAAAVVKLSTAYFLLTGGYVPVKRITCPRRVFV